MRLLAPNRPPTALSGAGVDVAPPATGRTRCARSEHDIVLLDTPLLLPVTGAAAAAPATDGGVLVCPFNSINTGQVHQAIKALPFASAPLLGTVLTMVPASGPRAYALHNGYYHTEQTATPRSAIRGHQPASSHTGVRQHGYAGHEFGQPERSPHRR